MNLLLFQQFRDQRLLLESTIGEMWKEYLLKTIDENNRKLTGNKAISGMIGGFEMLMLHKVFVRLQSEETLAT